MYDRALRFFPKYMDMCQNNPMKAKRIIKIMIISIVVWIAIGVLIVIKVALDTNVCLFMDNINIGRFLALSVYIMIYLIPALGLTNMVQELEYGVRYFESKKRKTQQETVKD